MRLPTGRQGVLIAEWGINKKVRQVESSKPKAQRSKLLLQHFCSRMNFARMNTVSLYFRCLVFENFISVEFSSTYAIKIPISFFLASILLHST